jgi:uncharacterized membrane protein YgcG
MRSRTSGTRRSARSLVVLAGLAVLLGPGVATAAPPAKVTEPVTDLVGVLEPATAAVERSVADLESSTGIALSVVLVRTFQTDAGQDWAEQTALRSGLGQTDVLLAIAVRDDGAYDYTWWHGESFPVPEDEVERMLTAAVEPALTAGFWASGVASLSEGLEAEMVDAGLDTSEFVATPWSRNTTIAILGGGVAVLLVGHLLSRRRGPAASTA